MIPAAVNQTDINMEMSWANLWENINVIFILKFCLGLIYFESKYKKS